MKKLIILVISVSIFCGQATARTRSCGQETAAGAVIGGVVGGILGAIIGKGTSNRPISGAIIGAGLGAGTGALTAYSSCEAQDALYMAMYGEEGEYYEWRDNDQYGIFEVVSKGSYYNDGIYYEECQEITSYFYQGSYLTGEEFDVSETMLFCVNNNSVETFESYSTNYSRY